LAVDSPLGAMIPLACKVILPQAIRTMIPSYINQLKDTSILSVIGIIYFIVITALTKLSDRLEKRINK
jgi:glutamine transport system permease protein